MKNTIETTDIEWTMNWPQEKYPDKPATELVFEEGPALAHLLLNEVVFLNSPWWLKDVPEPVKDATNVFVDCSDVFAWACADAETLPYSEIENVYRLWRADPQWGAAKWCAIQRKQQPQKPVIDRMKKAGVWDTIMENLGPNTQDAEVKEYFREVCSRMVPPPGGGG